MKRQSPGALCKVVARMKVFFLHRVPLPGKSPLAKAGEEPGPFNFFRSLILPTPFSLGGSTGMGHAKLLVIGIKISSERSSLRQSDIGSES